MLKSFFKQPLALILLLLVCGTALSVVLVWYLVLCCKILFYL